MANAQLKSIIERIERLEEERKDTGELIKDVYDEAKGLGFDTKILRKVIRLRKEDAAERERIEAEIDTYMNALQGA
jgi:uncharacterized protein (UPF0335 family)